MNNNDYLSIFEVICFIQNVTSLNEIKIILHMELMNKSKEENNSSTDNDCILVKFTVFFSNQLSYYY